jgi:hypothetical protein
MASMTPLDGGDFLHQPKNVRSRVLTYVPVIRYGFTPKEVHWEVMEEHLHLGAVFTDRTSPGLMSDSYPIDWFRLKHVRERLHGRHAAEAIYLFLWALAMVSVGSESIAKETRRFLFELTLHFLLFFYLDKTERHSPLNEQGPAGSGVLPLKPNILRRAIATIFGVMLALDKLDCDISLDRISTHPLENFFGLLRRLLHDFNAFDELRHAAAQNLIINEIYGQFGHSRDICGRANVGAIVSLKDGRILPQPTFGSVEASRQILAILQPQMLVQASYHPPRSMKWKK